MTVYAGRSDDGTVTVHGPMDSDDPMLIQIFGVKGPASDPGPLAPLQNRRTLVVRASPQVEG
jgi:hypothetical protein